MIVDEQLIRDIYREKVERARAMSDTEKLLAGPRLFERSCRIMCDGIRDQFPQASEEEVLRILQDRLAIVRRLES
jgi:hypothetical protein